MLNRITGKTNANPSWLNISSLIDRVAQMGNVAVPVARPVAVAV